MEPQKEPMFLLNCSNESSSTRVQELDAEQKALQAMEDGPLIA